jgi:CubicO group peptidase (beta-lactamase class C family)
LPITHSHFVSQTLTNRSGVGAYSEHPDMSGNYATAYAAAQDLWDTPLVSAPGAQCYYSTHAYTYAGASMEDAAGSPIDEILADTFQTPYGLSTLRAEDRSLPDADRSLLYGLDDDGNNAEVPADDLSWKVLGGGMEGSAYDLTRWGNRLTNGTVLNADSLDLLWTAPDGNCNYAFGWNTGTHLGHRVVAKRGSQRGARAYIRIYPDDDIVIVILSNRWTGKTIQLGRDIGAEILNAPTTMSAASARAVTQELDEPDSEAVPPEEIVWAPVSTPEHVPTEEETQEPQSDAVALFQSVFIPLVQR